MTDGKRMEARPDDLGAGAPPSSRQVDWYAVYAYAEKYAANEGLGLDPHLFPGTPQWCSMSDDDSRKLLALVLGGVRDALRNDAHQAAMVDASHAIAENTDAAALARHTRQGRGTAYIPRKAS